MTFEMLEDGSVYGGFSTERLHGFWSDAETEETREDVGAGIHHEVRIAARRTE